MIRLPAVCLCALGAALFAAQSAHASGQQGRPGEIVGRVVDFDNTPLPGIGVELIGPFPQTTRRSTVASSNARFVFSDLPAGRYRLSIELTDLSPRSNIDVTVNPGQRTETTLVLSLQGTTVNVVVLAEAPAIADADLSDPESTSGLRVVPGTTIENLPLPAEQALEVLPWLPGVVRGSEGQLAIDGTMPSDSVLLLPDASGLQAQNHRILRLCLPKRLELVEVHTVLNPLLYRCHCIPP